MNIHSVSKDHYYMKLAINLSERGLGNTWPNPSVGAIIVKNDKILSSGWTQPKGNPHAEIVALEKNSNFFNGSTLYTTLEPCVHYGKSSPCVDAIIKAKIKRVVIATLDPNPRVNGKGIKKLKQNNITVTLGLLQKEAKNINLGFFKKIKKDRPSVSTKIAISKNNKITDPENRWITSDDSRRYVHFLRAKHDAIITGINTVLKDNPMLNCRLPGMEKFSPIRVILDTHLRIKENYKIVKTSKKIKTYIFTANNINKKKINHLKKFGLKIIFVNKIFNKINLDEVLKILSKIGINNLLIESGVILNKEFFSQKLIDKIYYFQSPKIIKRGGLSFYKKITINKIKESNFKIISEKKLLDDKLLIYVR